MKKLVPKWLVLLATSCLSVGFCLFDDESVYFLLQRQRKSKANPSLAKVTQSRRWSKLLCMCHMSNIEKEHSIKGERKSFKKEKEKDIKSINTYSGWMAPKIACIANLLNALQSTITLGVYTSYIIHCEYFFFGKDCCVCDPLRVVSFLLLDQGFLFRGDIFKEGPIYRRFLNLWSLPIQRNISFDGSFLVDLILVKQTYRQFATIF